jgi:hypothetical protein
MAARKNLGRNSVGRLIEAHQQASEKPPLSWPSHIEFPEGQKALCLRMFAGYQAGRNPGHWKPHHETLLADLTRIDLEIQKLMLALAEEGPLVPSPNNPNQRIRNAVLDGLSMLQGQKSTILKSCGLVGAVSEKDSQARVNNEARIVQRKARGASDALLAGFASDDLIA